MTSKFPPITISILTYLRPVECRRTINALMENLRYSGDFHWLIADNASPGDYAAELQHDYRHVPHFKVISNPLMDRNWGSNANYALAQNTNDFMIMLEDDFLLTVPINLDPLVALLLLNSNVGLVRLDGVAGHNDLLASMQEWDISIHCPEYRQGMGMVGRLAYWQLEVPCQQLHVYSNHPHLKHRRFHQAHGVYPQHLGLGATEAAFAHQVKDNLTFHNAPKIVVPLECAVTTFDHVGTTWRVGAMEG